MGTIQQDERRAREDAPTAFCGPALVADPNRAINAPNGCAKTSTDHPARLHSPDEGAGTVGAIPVSDLQSEHCPGAHLAAQPHDPGRCRSSHEPAERMG